MKAVFLKIFTGVPTSLSFFTTLGVHCDSSTVPVMPILKPTVCLPGTGDWKARMPVEMTRVGVGVRIKVRVRVSYRDSDISIRDKLSCDEGEG